MEIDSIPKGPRHHNAWPRLCVGEPHQNKPSKSKPRVKIIPKFLPPGYRFLRPKEQVLETDFFWSEKNRCYLPMKNKIGGWAGLAGDVLPFIRGEDES